MKSHLRDSFVGRVRNHLTVLEEIFHESDSKLHTLKCRCDCGRIKIVRRKGFGFNAKSCSCLQKPILLPSGLRNRTFEVAAMNRQYYNHVNNAHSRSWKPLEREKWNELVNKPCYYCGKKDFRNTLRTHRRGKKRADIKYTEEEKQRYIVNINGIDRIDNTIDYTPENSVPCCGWCNTMKRNYTEKDFLQKIEDIYNYKIKQSSLT